VLFLLDDGLLGEEGFFEEGLLEGGGFFYYERLGWLWVGGLWGEVCGEMFRGFQ
jgi:hypothetical protein